MERTLGNMFSTTFQNRLLRLLYNFDVNKQAWDDDPLSTGVSVFLHLHDIKTDLKTTIFSWTENTNLYFFVLSSSVFLVLCVPTGMIITVVCVIK